MRLTCSVSCPPSSKPTYPGGLPISFDTLCASINSLISRRMILFSSSNNASASAFASSVLPTPVEPRNKKLPIGRRGSRIPILLLLIAFATFSTASSCPLTRSFKTFSRFNNFSASPSVSLVKGMFVHLLTTSATSCSEIVAIFWIVLGEVFAFSISSFSFIILSRSLLARSKSSCVTASSFSASHFLSFSRKDFTSSES